MPKYCCRSTLDVALPPLPNIVMSMVYKLDNVRSILRIANVLASVATLEMRTCQRGNAGKKKSSSLTETTCTCEIRKAPKQKLLSDE